MALVARFVRALRLLVSRPRGQRRRRGVIGPATEQPPTPEPAELDRGRAGHEEAEPDESPPESLGPSPGMQFEAAQSEDALGEGELDEAAELRRVASELAGQGEDLADRGESGPQRHDDRLPLERRPRLPPRRPRWPFDSQGARLPRVAAAHRITEWNQVLCDELLPPQPRQRTPVLLACDDETVRVVGERLGYEGSETVTRLAGAVRASYEISPQVGLLKLAQLGGDFERQPRPRPLPDYLAALCLLVLAASRMGADARNATAAYYPRLRLLLGLPGEGALPHFEYVPELFRQLEGWLADDLSGSRGHLILPDEFSPRYVGACISQTVFRERDRQVLSKFFSERMRSSVDGFDPLRRLRRWSGRHELTHHALELVEDETVAERVRAAIVSAHRSWDGAELIETRGGTGRLWPARLRFLPYPPRLHLAAANARPLEFELRGDRYLLDPQRAVEVPWKLLDLARARPLILGESASSAGAVRVPAVGDVLVFELGEEGLHHVGRPSAEEVWVLTRNRALQAKLEAFSFRDNRLPEEWRVFRDVTLDELPQVERAVAPREQEDFRLEGGLPVQRHVYLSGYPPLLTAGDLDFEGRLTVFVNGAAIGTVASGEDLSLPAGPGDHVVAVEEEWEARYEVNEYGDPEAYGSLEHDLDSPRALRSGARPRRKDSKIAVCGASISIPYDRDPPILTRTSAKLFSLDDRGDLAHHQRPPTPAWFGKVGFGGGWRWEIMRPDVVWVLCVDPPFGPRWAQLHRNDRIQGLSTDSARIVLTLLGCVRLLSRKGADFDVEDAWRALVELAERSNA